MANVDAFVIVASCSHPLLLTEYTAKGLGVAPVEVNIENERFAVVFSRYLKFGNSTLSFGRLRRRIALECVPHVQHDYFSSSNQSDHCFVGVVVAVAVAVVLASAPSYNEAEQWQATKGQLLTSTFSVTTLR